eukprot:CAMPEP_0194412472 /NCGR_PEP_ID=MMETSP0176-20130528/10950_1 /TAXON_ID=216777 /ORGANISM="Proboscia alata, Strain PI-D3" /LENGTH=464 /DNA_ID=CAMNT_0039215251 /DNA_START=49 /DNA_END=1443 /DNA_ORIENTATION=+
MAESTSADAVYPVKNKRARSNLNQLNLYLGELRDGLAMLNFQNIFLITSRHYTEKQAGIIFVVFGITQFCFQTPMGYILDHSDRKTLILGTACVVTSCLTLITVIWSEDYAGNFGWMVFVKFLQGICTATIPTSLNSITQGIVGTVGMTFQASRNDMMSHLGTSINVLFASILAYYLYPNIELIFIVSPLACSGVLYKLCHIRPDDIDLMEARGLKKSTDDLTACYGAVDGVSKEKVLYDEPDTIREVMRNKTLLLFMFITFVYDSANATILPLVMQTLAVGNGRLGAFMSGMCIVIGQGTMVLASKLCGDYSGIYGRKPLFSIGLFSVPVRCLVLTTLVRMRNAGGDTTTLNFFILGTQFFDGIGAGVFGTMLTLVSSDIAVGTGRFSLMLGLSTAAMSMGATVSGYLGEALAQDLGYPRAFEIIGCLALAAALLYVCVMPETLGLNERRYTEAETEKEKLLA